MIERKKIIDILKNYGKEIVIGTIGSHSALDICDGAFEEGFKTLVCAEYGREKLYKKYFQYNEKTFSKKSRKSFGVCGKLRFPDNMGKGMIHEVIVFKKFNELTKKENIEKLKKKNVIFVPNRALTSYIDIESVESLALPLFGSRNLLRTEERSEKKNYYWLLEKASLPYPEEIKDEKEIDALVIVKLPHAVKKLERGFFTCASYKEYKKKAEQLIRNGIIKEEDLRNARIEKYIIGPVFNLNFFFSPIDRALELLGIDWRFETSLDGHVRLPAEQQSSLPESQFYPEYTVCGHNMATLRESLLEKAYELGEKYVKATKKFYKPGIIGPFCLQTCIDKDLKFYIYDVAPRIGGGTNVHMALGHAYANALWRKNVSTGRRIAMEIKRGIELDRADLLFT